MPAETILEPPVPDSLRPDLRDLGADLLGIRVPQFVEQGQTSPSRLAVVQEWP
ncbi:MAG TPA: hypothetical protein VEV63_16345 [Streptosporangiaceae bacterium]|nr:hypothetical protein [Streptosporangiaceae bacterium]